MEDNQFKIHGGEIITLNDDQYNVVKKIRNWLKSNNNNHFFTLAGYSGSGKTTIIKKIIDDYRGNVIVSAPTHKAKKVISKITNCDSDTLHSILGLRPDVVLEDFNPNDPQFNPIAEPKIKNCRFIIIDEASMINEDLFDLIKKMIEKYSTYKKKKILFVGDPAQIPPVNEKESVVFTNKIGEVFWLTKVMRQANTNPMFEVYNKLRENLKLSDGGYVRKTLLNDKGEGIIFTNNKKFFREKIKKYFASPEYKRNVDHVKLVCWRNITVMKSNLLIRNLIFDNPNEIVLNDEVLMAYRTVYNNLMEPIIENSTDYKVVHVSDKTTNEYGINGYDVKISEKLNNGRFRFTNIFVVDHKDFDNLHDYAEIHDALRDIAKSSKNKIKWKEYYKFRQLNMIMTNIKQFRDGSNRPYYDIIVKDLDYAYACTGHKIQGSTYEYILVLEDDINCNPIIKERNQIKYVAISRPKKLSIVYTTKALNDEKE